MLLLLLSLLLLLLCNQTWFCILQDFSTSWDIKATPTFFFLRDGQEIDKLVGANKPELEKKIAAVNLVPQYQ